MNMMNAVQRHRLNMVVEILRDEKRNVMADAIEGALGAATVRFGEAQRLIARTRDHLKCENSLSKETRQSSRNSLLEDIKAFFSGEPVEVTPEEG